MQSRGLNLDQAARLIGTTPEKLQETAGAVGIDLQTENIDPLEFVQLLATSRLKIKVNREKNPLSFEIMTFLRHENETIYFLMVEPEEEPGRFEPFFLEVRASQEADNIFELLPTIKNILIEIEEFDSKLIKISREKIEIMDVVPPAFEI